MEKHTFLLVFQRYVEYHDNNRLIYDKKAKATVQSYKCRLELLKIFLKHGRQLDIKAEDFRPSVCKRFFDGLASRYSHNYSARVASSCSTVLDWAVNNDLVTHNPLKSFSIPIAPPKKPPYFTPAQIEIWQKYQSSEPMKQKAADLFTLIINTGFDYGDLAEIRRFHVVMHRGQRYIIKPRHKNGNEAVIPLSSTAEGILEKYNYRMRILSNPLFNKMVKEVAKEVGIDIYLTAKSGRKIFGMNKINNEGYSIESGSKMLGHKSIKTTEQTYIQVNINLVHSEVIRNISNFQQK